MKSKKVLYTSIGLLAGLTILLVVVFFNSSSTQNEGSETMTNAEIDSKLSLLQGGILSSNIPASTTTDTEGGSVIESFLDENDNTAAVRRTKSCGLTASMVAEKTSATTFRYIITLKNAGRSVCRDIAFSAYYPSGEEYATGNPPPSASNYYWKVGSLNPGISRTYTMTTKHDGENEPGVDVCATTSSLSGDVCAVAAAPSVPVGPVVTTSPEVVPAVPASTTVSGEYGLWLWHSAVTLSGTKMDTVIADAKRAGFNVIYITVDDWMAYDSAEYYAALATFVRKAEAQGIAVDALAGAANWAEPAHREKGYGVIDFVLAYKAQGLPLRGFQFDVEPYLLSTYESNKAPVLTNFVEFIDVSTAKLESSPLRFGVVIPHFYDSEQAWTPAITYGNQTAHTFTHLLRILNRKTNSTIIVMSYRNFFEGNNGVRQLSSPEITEARGSATKVIVAQEVGNVEPDYVTYFGTTKSLLTSNIALINNTFGTESGFGGVAIHHYDPYLLLR
ncbi:DUF11 domain-containing protein [Patescibacteria group bacterium]|nr:DUF11 domain-containing protein [Patescibacteria group bacterium]